MFQFHFCEIKRKIKSYRNLKIFRNLLKLVEIFFVLMFAVSLNRNLHISSKCFGAI